MCMDQIENAIDVFEYEGNPCVTKTVLVDEDDQLVLEEKEPEPVVLI